MTSVHDASGSVKVSVWGTGKVRVTVEVGCGNPLRRSLKFGNGNSKLAEGIFTFSLPAGHFCPFANECKSKASRKDGTITDGPNTTFRCFAASNE